MGTLEVSFPLSLLDERSACFCMLKEKSRVARSEPAPNTCRCDALILTRQSTFGYTAAGMSGSVPHTVFEHKVERRFHCGPFQLCDMAPYEMGM